MRLQTIPALMVTRSLLFCGWLTSPSPAGYVNCSRRMNLGLAFRVITDPGKASWMGQQGRALCSPWRNGGAYKQA